MTESFKKTTVNICFNQVNTELLEIMLGEPIGRNPTQPITVYISIKRTLWQWLRRKPKQHRAIYLPNAQITQYDADHD